jgi:hypothetical protein
MSAIMIFLTSFGTAYLAARFSGRGQFSLADMTIGVFTGIAGVCLLGVLSAQGTVAEIGLPLFVVCALTLGLESIESRSSWR